MKRNVGKVRLVAKLGRTGVRKVKASPTAELVPIPMGEQSDFAGSDVISVHASVQLKRNMFSEARGVLTQHSENPEKDGTLRKAFGAVQKGIRNTTTKKHVINALQEEIHGAMDTLKDNEPAGDAKLKDGEHLAQLLEQFSTLLTATEKLNVQADRQEVFNHTINLIQERVANLVRLHGLSASHVQDYEDLRETMRAQAQVTRRLLAKLGVDVAHVHHAHETQAKTKSPIWFDAPAHCLYSVGVLHDALNRFVAAVDPEEDDFGPSPRGCQNVSEEQTRTEDAQYHAMDGAQEPSKEDPTVAKVQGDVSSGAQASNPRDGVKVQAAVSSLLEHAEPEATFDGCPDAVVGLSADMTASVSSITNTTAAETALHRDAGTLATDVPVVTHQASKPSKASSRIAADLSGVSTPSSISCGSVVVLPTLVDQVRPPAVPRPPVQSPPLRRSPVNHRILVESTKSDSRQSPVTLFSSFGADSSVAKASEATTSAVSDRATDVVDDDNSFEWTMEGLNSSELKLLAEIVSEGHTEACQLLPVKTNRAPPKRSSYRPTDLPTLLGRKRRHSTSACVPNPSVAARRSALRPQAPKSGKGHGCPAPC